MLSVYALRWVESSISFHKVEVSGVGCGSKDVLMGDFISNGSYSKWQYTVLFVTYCGSHFPKSIAIRTLTLGTSNFTYYSYFLLFASV